MTNIGICFGGYCPLHRGHLDIILRAKKENDICIVVVCGYDNEPRANEIGLPLSKRYQLVKEFFKNDEIIKIIAINETELGLDDSMSISNWRIWFTEVFKKSGIEKMNATDIFLNVYVAEERYERDILTVYSEKRFAYNYCQDYKIHLMERILPVSGTEIRKNPLKFWDYIAKPFQKFFTKNILIIGTASEGKTTLVRDISKYFNIPHIEEYGRTYMEDRNMLDTDLTCHDFTEFLFNQRSELLDAEESDANNKGVVISDTDNLITLMYAKAYSVDNNIQFTKEEFESLKDLVKKHLTKGVYWDKIFIIPPGNKFVNDGSRYMEQSSIEKRQKNYETLKSLIKEVVPEYIPKMVELKTKEYYYNFLTVKNYINSIL